MGKRYVIALDQGTTSSRSMLIDAQGRAVGCVQREFPQIYPQPGWVDHDPKDIAASQLGTFTELMTQYNLTPDDIDCIGITNQRETTIIWDRASGEPIANAIVWQCRRTAQVIQELCGDSDEVREQIVRRTGLRPDPYFSASKARWLLDNVPGARERAERGELAFGTVDSWLVWNLTNGRVHATDPTNASRTMLYNIHSGEWDPYLLDLFGIPASMMPEVRPSSSSFGATANPNLPQGIPITGVAGDQQAALFGQCCFEPGQAKNTYGTGCFFLMNTGSQAPLSTNNLVTTIAASAPGQPCTYALEGSVFVSGALIQWLRDSLGLIGSALPGAPPARTSPARPWRAWPTRCTIWPCAWRQMPAAPSRPSTSTAGLPATTSSCSSKATSWAPRCAVPPTQRPRPWERPSWPAFRAATGRASTSCAACAAATRSSSRRCRASRLSACSTAGRTLCAAR